MSERDSAPVERMAVVGAGTRGVAIARGIAASGISVDLVDFDAEKVLLGLDSMRDSLLHDVERGVISESRSGAILERIHALDDWERLSRSALVVETVFENLDLKREVFRKLERVCRPDAILATNTSAFRVGRIARVLAEPSRIIGLHHFFHGAKNRLVEVVPTEETPTAVREIVWAMQQRIGKTSILSADSPGFVVHRFLLPWLGEAVRILEDELADIPTIEAASKRLFGPKLGPFELMNRSGLSFVLETSRTLGGALGPFYEPPVELARRCESSETWSLAGAPDSTRFEAVEQRLAAAVFLSAGQLADERVGSIEDVDIGARVGLGWPMGPFQLLNEVGLGHAAEWVDPLAGRWNLDLPECISSRAESGRAFEFCRVRSTVRDRVATLTIHRPDSLNALNDQVVSQLTDEFHRAASDPDVDGIVLAGSGGSFIVGADIRFFLEHLERRDLAPLVEFTKSAHLLLNAIEHSHKPVVARVHGLALGGGLEIALACQRIVATPEARFGFPETGLGIYPGLGGTQRTARRIGLGLAKALIFTGETIDAESAAAIGLIDAVVPYSDLAGTIRTMIGDRSAHGEAPKLDGKWAMLSKFFEHHAVEDLRTGRVDTDGEPLLAHAVDQVGVKAPLALRVAEQLIEKGFERPLHEGLHMELEHLHEIFLTQDAYEGLSAAGSRKPKFEGH